MADADSMNERLSLIDQTIADGESVPDTISRLLEIGTEQLDVSGGYLTRIDPATDTGVVLESTEGVVEAGEAFHLGDSYSRKVIETGRHVATDIETDAWSPEPGLERVASYLGIRLTINGIDGTLCFVAETDRDEPFSPEEVLFADALARRVEQLWTGEVVADRIDHLEGFVSIISHDMRNPLTVARGWVEAEQATENREPLDRALIAIGRIEDLIETGVSYARAAQPVTRTEVVSLAGRAETRWQSVNQGDATLEIAGDLRFVAEPSRLRRFFDPLFENAVEHGGPTVTVRVGPLEEDPGFFIADDGPGIAPSIEEELFEPGVAGNGADAGFGLAMVKATADAHQWSISAVRESSSGARFEVRDVIVPST